MINKWVQDILGERSLLQCALDVHMTTTGAMERGEYEQQNDVAALTSALMTWTPGASFTADFDQAVYQLLTVTLQEYTQKNGHS